MAGRLAYIALGANLDGPQRQVTTAMQELTALPDTRVLERSSLYRTTAVGGPSQPDYINACAKIETTLDARVLLDELLRIEAAHGRRRSYTNAPRTLDLDLLLYDDQVIEQPGLRVPHPRMHQRAFVLLPLHEIAPELVIPGHGAIEHLIENIALTGVSKQHAA